MRRTLLLLLSNLLIYGSLAGIVGVLVWYLHVGSEAPAPAPGGSFSAPAPAPDAFEIIVPGIETDRPDSPPPSDEQPEDRSGPHGPAEVAVTLDEQTGAAADGCTVETFVHAAPLDAMTTVGVEVDCTEDPWVTGDEVDYCALFNARGDRLIGVYGVGTAAADVPLTDGTFTLRCDRTLPRDDGEALVRAAVQREFTVTGSDPASPAEPSREQAA